MSVVSQMNRKQRREAKRTLQKSNAQYPGHLVAFEYSSAQRPPGFIKALRSVDFLVQLYEAPEPCVCRLTINRAQIIDNEWGADIPWEDLQRLKNEAGFSDHDAVEVFPRAADVVNVANMRHLFIMAEPLDFAWRQK